uniref:NADP-dependent oxidoreductase n=1 Tax=uncultured Amnibacterium sp. TaxID=1631851 RepID=UPI0035CA0AC5
DLAGTVVACGPAVTAFEPGDRVCALIGHVGGAQSDLVLLRQGRAARIPDAVPFVPAAALPLAGLTALQGLHRAGRLRARSSGRARVLVLGASGGIGAFAVQLARLAGAAVTASTTGRTLDFVRSLGPDAVLDRDREAPLRPGDGWDLVFDTPGRLRLRDVEPSLAPHGVLVSTRGVSPDAVRSLARGRRGPEFASVRTAARPADLDLLLRLVAEDRLRVPVHRVLPMAQAAEAHRDAEQGAEGKVVIELLPGSAPDPA